MLRTVFHILLTTIFILAGFVFVSAQAEDSFPGERSRRREMPPPVGVREMLDRMRIDKEKKDHEEMIARGEEVIKLADQLEKSFDDRGQLSQDDLAMLQSIEKDVKKIRSELGGSDGEDDKAADTEGGSRELTVKTAVSSLRSASAELLDQLKASTRFSISVPAIEASNATLKFARFLLRK